MIAVLDASSLLLAADSGDESLQASAQEVRVALAHRGRLMAPALVVWELGNVIFHKHPHRFGGTVAERRRRHALLLRDLGLDLPTPDIAGRTAQTAAAHGLSYYDAAYLELAARDPDGLLITEDRRLLAAGRELLGEDRCLDASAAWQAIQDGRL